MFARVILRGLEGEGGEGGWREQREGKGREGEGGKREEEGNEGEGQEGGWRELREGGNEREGEGEKGGLASVVSLFMDCKDVSAFRKLMFIELVRGKLCGAREVLL
jgi:hypothetical protein